ncbi:hypothetical protein ATCC90586_000881 [Pythium insidiosum]|nr:hypothetical protein ATCC90586_000881 [Pythium insidiosum]
MVSPTNSQGRGLRNRLQQHFTQCRMDHLRFLLGCQLLQTRRRQSSSEDKTATTTEPSGDDIPKTLVTLLSDEDLDVGFALELENFHDVLVHATNVISDPEIWLSLRQSLEQYVHQWPGAMDAIAMWWSERELGRSTALEADLVMVVPGLWIGSGVTAAPENAALLATKRIRHVVFCTTTRPDSDDDFEHGATHARQQLSLDDTTRYPVIASAQSSPEASERRQHSLTLLELGRMESLYRRRLKSMYVAVRELDAVCNFLGGLMDVCEQRSLENGDNTVLIDSHVDGVLVYCESGVSTAPTVCLAFLMARYKLPLEIARHALETARFDVAPSSYFEFQLEQYDQALAARRQGGA